MNELALWRLRYTWHKVLERIGVREDTMADIVGGCLCGNVRYSSDAEPAMTAVCHCSHCQKQTSSAFSILVAVPKGSLQIEGEPLSAYETEGESGQPLIRKFCRNCGSGIVTDVTVTPDLEWIKAGTLDDTSWLQPQVHWWCDSAQPWVKIDEAVPAFAGNPPLG
jgi:hypothetical protein